MACPVKYRELGDFPDYYSGTRTAPYLTIFIAGNHEASSHLWELYYGGWVAPNIYYLGAANVLRLGPIRIAGMSGIWKGFDYRKPHFERLPFSESDVRSFYHVREYDVRKLLLLQTQVDIGLSHDWPRAIERHGDSEWLFRKKRDFRQESEDGTLGNVAAEYVLDRLRPPYWFSAHLHVKYAALKKFDDAPAPGSAEPQTTAVEAPAPSKYESIKEANPDEIDLDLDDDDDDDADGNAGGAAIGKDADKVAENSEPTNGEAEKTETNEVSEELRAQLPASFAKPPPRPKHRPGQPVPAGITNKEVRFLALDKCLPGRHFLQLCEARPFDEQQLSLHPPKSDSPRYTLQYDPEWLAITRVFHSGLVIGDPSSETPTDLGEEHYLPLIEEERKWVEENIVQKNKLEVPHNFQQTAQPYEQGTPEIVHYQPDEYTNPQTVAFCELMGLENLWNASAEERQERKDRGPAPPADRGGRGHHGGGRGFGRGRGRGHGRGGRGRGRGGHRGRW